MKRFFNYYLSMTLIASLFLVTSCEDDAEDPIESATTFTITGVEEGEEAGTTVNVGETVDFNVGVVVPAGFNTFIVNQTVGTNTVEFDRDSRTAGVPTSTYSYDFTYTPDEDVAGEAVIFDFIVVDENNNETNYTYTVNVNEREVNAWTTVLLNAPAGDGTSESFFSTTTGETYSSNEVTETQASVSPLIDFGYFYGVTRAATLASPAQFPTAAGQAAWDTRNETSLRLTDLDASAFNESNAAAIEAAFDDAEFGNNEGQVTNLEVGDVVAFETDPQSEGGSRRGLIHVVDITPGTSPITDLIEIDVRVIE